ncbi:MAG: multiprotein bridging factor aMBF1 [Candidatus Micrarchaeota archaeon]|nr:multiprotein bridging factor aMBF1 [Candidatus Micrarchaeota archaeon]
MECEICGSAEAEYLIQVEGAKLRVCRDCSDTGRLLAGPPPKPQKAGVKQDGSLAEGRQELEVVEGYGSIISSARKKMGLPLEVLAERINEKASFLERVEHEKTLPDEKLCRKLEKELHIRLLEPAVSSGTAESKKSAGGVTLGDIIEIEKKKPAKGG